MTGRELTYLRIIADYEVDFSPFWACRDYFEREAERLYLENPEYWDNIAKKYYPDE